MRPILEALIGNKLILEALQSDDPFMAARLGKVEADFINMRLQGQPWNDQIRFQISNNAGVFSNDDQGLEDFYRVFTTSLDRADLMAVWLNDY